jgi:U3 small nucleolar RNA-associated protein 10
MCVSVCVVRAQTLWHGLNSAVLLRTRSKAAPVRLSAVRVVAGWFERIGAPFAVMIPETVPFLAEIMDDSDAAVERAAHALAKTIETVTGESVDELLRKR